MKRYLGLYYIVTIVMVQISQISLKKTGFLFTLPLLVLFLSCVAEINGVVREGGAAEFSLDAAMGPRTTALIRSLRMFAGAPADAPILDGAAIAHSMALAPGVSAASLRNTSPEAMEGNIAISNIGDFLALPYAETRFITFTESGGTSSITIVLDRTSAPQLISALSEEISGYLSALMAPIALGMPMTAREYIDLLAMIYTRPLADEIAAARIRMTIEFPRPIRAIQGGTFSGNRAVFDIPLLDILVLEQPLRYEVSW